MSTLNPYAPPKDEGHVAAAPRTDGVVTCTFLQTEEDFAEGLLLTAKATRYSLATFGAFMGFAAINVLGPGVAIAASAALGVAGWFLAPKLISRNAKRALVNKSETERTVTWRFSAEGYEVTTAHSHNRSDWSTLHRFIEGPKSFVLYVSEVLAHIIPKRALHPSDVPVLVAMLTSHVTPRKKPKVWPRVLVLWLLLILMFLAVWQYFESVK